MGVLEKELEKAGAVYQRLALERLVQERAGQVPEQCPRCSGPLTVEARQRSREVRSKFGKLRFARAYGYCKACGDWQYPADLALALQERAPSSPRVQEICALTALRDPAVNVQQDIRRLAGIDMDPSCIHREARRQGVRAQALRDMEALLAGKQEGMAELAARASVPQEPFTLVIQMDAWNIRERDDWGRT